VPTRVESVLRGLHWTVTKVLHDLSMVHRLQPEYLTLFEDFLLAKPWFVVVFNPTTTGPSGR
jgi:hypothetical protein